jgi:hypothetical protein
VCVCVCVSLWCLLFDPHWSKYPSNLRVCLRNRATENSSTLLVSKRRHVFNVSPPIRSTQQNSCCSITKSTMKRMHQKQTKKQKTDWKSDLSWLSYGSACLLISFNWIHRSSRSWSLWSGRAIIDIWRRSPISSKHVRLYDVCSSILAAPHTHQI